MDDIIESIRANIQYLEKIVEKNNFLCMPNSAHRFEDVVCELLNARYGWKLKNCNNEDKNFLFIDLYDESNKITVQVTTQQAKSIKEKIKRTFKKAKENYPDTEVLFYSMFGYPNLPDLSSIGIGKAQLLSDISFIEELSNCPDPHILENILSILQRSLDVKELSFVPRALFDEDMSKECSVVEGNNITAFAHGLGRVRVTAYVPKNTESEFGMLVEFGKYSTRDAFISFNEINATEVLFVNFGSELSDRPFIVQVIEKPDLVTIQLGNVRLYVDNDTANQLCRLIDEVHIIYEQNKSMVEKTIGAEKEELSSMYKPHVFLWHIPNSVWREIKNAEKQCMENNGKLCDRIIPNWSPNVLQITNDKGHSIACCIERKGIVDSDECDLFWTPGFVYCGTMEENYNNGKLMKVNEARQWLYDEFFQPMLMEQKRLHSKKSVQNSRSLVNRVSSLFSRRKG